MVEIIDVNFKINGAIKNLSLRTIGHYLSDLIEFGSDASAMIISDMIFSSKSTVAFKDIKELKDIIDNQISILDYLMIKKLYEDGKIEENFEFKEHSDKYLRTFNSMQYSLAITMAYFMIMTRGKIIIDDNETIPIFAKKYLGFNLNMKDYILILTENSINKLNNEWILDIETSKLSNAMINRLKRSTCGTRKLNIFKKYAFNDDLIGIENFICNNLKKLALNGPYWELHPIMNKMGDCAFSKNLDNIIMTCYKPEIVEKMIAEKALYCRPNINNSSTEWRNWDQAFFDSFKLKIFKD